MLTQEILKVPVAKLIHAKTQMWALVRKYFKKANIIKTVMGMINAQIYGLCKRGGVFTEVYEKGTSKKMRLINKENLLKVAANCESGLGVVSNAVTWLSEYLQEFWEGACYSHKTIRRVRQLLMDKFNLFTFVPGVKGETVSPVDCIGVDLFGLLLLYETLEEELISRFVPQEEKALYEAENGWIGELSLETGYATPGVTFKGIIPGEDALSCLTYHRGAIMPLVFNALLGEEFRKYRHPEEDTVFTRLECDTQAIELPVVEAEEVPPAEPIIPVWKSHFKLSEWSWRSMLSKMWNAEPILEWLGLKEEELLYPVF